MLKGRTIETYPVDAHAVESIALKGDARLKQAFLYGVSDGLAQPYDLTSGITYPDDNRNRAYDHGVNVGQAAGRDQRQT